MCTWSLSSPVCPGTPAPRVTSASSSLVSSKTPESVISLTESKRYHLLRHLYNQLNLYNFLLKVTRTILNRILFAIHMYIFFNIAQGFETGSVFTYVMTVQDSLGDLTFLNIWHDNSGKGGDASWNLIKVVVEDAHTGKRCVTRNFLLRNICRVD